MDKQPYRDIVLHTPLIRDENQKINEFENSSQFVAAIMTRGCGYSFPKGNCTEALAILNGVQNFSRWISLGDNCMEAQMQANSGRAVIAANRHNMAVVMPGDQIFPAEAGSLSISQAGYPDPFYDMKLDDCWPADLRGHITFFFFDPGHGL